VSSGCIRLTNQDVTDLFNVSKSVAGSSPASLTTAVKVMPHAQLLQTGRNARLFAEAQSMKHWFN
jgi:hypothetical protein